jgi:hypothetical protein
MSVAKLVVDALLTLAFMAVVWNSVFSMCIAYDAKTFNTEVVFHVCA